MMAGYRLVQGQRLHLIFRSSVELVSVEHVQTSSRSVRCARLIVSSRLRGCFIVGDDFYAVGCPWKFSEQLRQLAVGSFRDVAIPGDQIIRIRIVKTLV